MQQQNDPESPTQYYLSELGLDLEWRNSLLQFGPNEQGTPEYIRNEPTSESISSAIRTYPHIIIPASETTGVVPRPDLTWSAVATAAVQPKNDLVPCPISCSNSAAWAVVVESLREAHPEPHSLAGLSRNEVINKVISTLKDQRRLLQRVQELERENEAYRTTCQAPNPSSSK